MSARIKWTLLACLPLVVAGCSLLLDFNPEGQPCDQDGQCLDGYGCVDGRCVRGADAGVPCELCPSGGCFPGTNECIPNTCEYKVCPPHAYCDDNQGATPTCRPIAPGALGGSCFADTGCLSTGVATPRCLISAIQVEDTGGPRPGICVEPCGPDGECATGASCRVFELGADAGSTQVCLPDNAITACLDDQVCAGEGLTCTVFDHPEIGPIKACDAPLASGAATGEPCVRVRDPDAGVAVCANGLCVPQSPSANEPSTCAETCTDTSCPEGQVCVLVPIAVQQDVPLRYLPVCQPGPTACLPCEAGDAGVCGADAPFCMGFNMARYCLGPCTPDAGAHQCPPDFECTTFTNGAHRCTPVTGACP